MKAGSRSFRRALALRFAILNVIILGTLGVALYVVTYRTTTRLLEQNLHRTTDTVAGFIEEVATTSVTSYLRASVDRVQDLVAGNYRQYASGKVSEAAAKREIFRELSALRVGETGYAYILDTNGFMVYHPSPGLNDRPAPSGGPLADQLRMREGYLEYTWRNPEEATAQAKAMYMSFFAPWHWILTATSYRREFDSLVNPESFRDYVLSLTFGKSGYVFIARMDGSIVIHPRLSGNPLQETGDSELANLFQTMRAHTEGSTLYSWRNPGEPARVRKLIYFRQLPRLQWVVGSTISLAELYAPAYQAGLSILAAIALAAALAALLSASLAALLTRPIESLAVRLEQGAAGDFSIRMPISRDDEIGKLADHFNRFMDGLQASRDRLTDSIRERTQAQAAAARLAAAVGQIAEHVLITDSEGRIVYVNSAFEQGSGYPAPEVMGQSPRLLKSGRHEPSFYAEIWSTLRAGKVWQGRLTNRRRDGSEYIQEGTITPIRDEAGTVVSYLQVCRDITQDVQRELHQRQSQKLEAVGTLAGGIAHDFNNILAAILGFSELAGMQLEPTHPARSSVSEIVQAATRARDLVAKILTFSRRSPREVRPVRMEALLRDSLSLIRASLPSTIRIDQHLPAETKPVLADPIEMHQLVMNLCTNAAQAIGARPGTIRVTLRSVRTMDPSTGAMRAGIELDVEDDGDGMTDEVMARMFEPFFTTKQAGKGSGLGLSVVHGIVSQMEGQITAKSSPGNGTSFRVMLPCREDLPAPSESAAETVATGHGEHILLVDDEPAVRTMAAKVLESLGYRVTTVSRAAAALAALERTPDQFDLLLTDQTMPEMTGIDLARFVAGRYPSLAVVLMTGSRDVSIQEQARGAGVRELMNKPFRRAEVALVLRRVLEYGGHGAG